MTPPDQSTPTRAQRRAERLACPKRRKRRRRTRQCGYGLLGLTLGFIALVLILTRSPLATRLIVPRLSDMTSTPIEADRVYVGLNGSIVLEGATFFVPGMARPTETPGAEARFFEVDRAVVWMDWRSIFAGMPVVETIELERPLFRLSHAKDTGRLNIAGLSFLMQDAGLGDVPDTFHLPVLNASDGVIEIGEHDDAGYTALKRIPVVGDLVPMALPGGQTFGFRLRQVPDERGRRGIDISGRYDADGLAITLEEFVLSDWSSDVVPTKVRDLYDRLALTGAIGETTLRVSPAGKPSATMSLERVGVTLPFDLSGAAATDQALRMEDTTGTIEVSADGVHAKLSGMLDELAYAVELDSDGVEPTSPFRCTLMTDTRLSSDMRLLFAAPDAVLDPIGFFIEPEADVQATIRLERPAGDGVMPIRKTGELRFYNGTTAYRNFPYQFTNLEGVARFDDTTLSIDSIRGTHPNGAVLEATGTFAPLGPESEVNLLVQVEGVPIDDELRAAMSKGRRQMVDALFSQRRHEALLDAGLVTPPGTGPDAFAFGGRADVDINIQRAFGTEGIWTRTIDVRVPRAGLVPDHFPLPMIAEDVSISINEQVAHLSGGVYRGLSGGTAQVEATVALADEDGNPIRDPIPSVEIHALDIPVDARLRAAIPGYASSDPGTPGTLRDMLDRLGLEGEADCEALIAARPDGSLGYEVRAWVDGLTSRPVPRVGAPAGPLALTDVRGTIEVNERIVGLDLTGGLVFDDAAPAPASPFTLDATIGYERTSPGFAPSSVSDADAGPTADGPSLDVRMTAEGLDLETPLQHAVSVFSPSWGERVSGWRDAYRPSGRVTASARFDGNVGGDLFAEIELSDVERASWGLGADRIDVGRSVGSLVLRTGPEPWVRAESVAAPVWYGRERVGTLRANGVLPLVRTGETRPGGWAWDELMEVAVDDARFESSFTRRVIASRLDPGTRETLEDRRPTGAYDLQLRLRPTGITIGAHEPGVLALPELDLAGSIGPRSLAFDHAGERVDLGAMHGWLRFEEAGGIIENVRVDAGAWRATADGRWTLTDTGGRVEAALDVATEAGVPQGLLALLPETIGDAVSALEIDATGPVTARDVVLEVEQNEGDDRWAYATVGAVSFEDAALDTGVELTELAGTMRFSASREPGAGRGEYRIEALADRGRAAGVRFTDAGVEAHEGRSAGETMIPRIEAQVHGGRVAGSARITEREGVTSYTTDLVASGVRAAPVFDDLGVSPTPDEPAAMSARADPASIREAQDADRTKWNNVDDRSRGVIEGSFSMAGVAGDPDSRSGRGSVQVTGGRVLALPGIMQLIEFSNLQPPLGESLSAAEASFYIDGPTLTFEQVSVFSRSVEIFGYGTMTMPGKDLEMNFNSRSVNPIPVVSRLLEGLRDELITTRVRGTPGELELTTEQLPGAKRIIRSIFGDPPSSEEERLRDVESRARQGQQRALRSASRAAEQAAMPAADGVIVRDERPSRADDDAGVPTLVVQPTDDE
ncbi:MAG: hypothetical protein RIB60_06445 [Phycisphaerales bacterium]